MIFAFRADASARIGAGHLMRCLTLADRLRLLGHASHFLTRNPPPHLQATIAARGHGLLLLPAAAPGESVPPDPQAPPHADWLDGSWEDDARACRAALAPLGADWLVVDHYALDARWEAALEPVGARLLVIDDLADRPHRAAALLDVNAGRRAEDYDRWLPAGSQRLIGPRYALLRPEFAEARAASLERRRQPALRHILVTMGGVDLPDATSAALAGLQAATLPADASVTVVMGRGAPWLDAVRAQAAALRWPAEVLVDVPDMAAQMQRADLAIGAAGGTAWERCCLGLPAVVVVLAENQRPGARALAAAGAAQLVERVDELARRLPECLAAWSSPAALARAGQCAADLVDGQGAARVCEVLLQWR
jgi:UDP-2,4-diacetamido-2,4,6-trideoxy-beta-L-altropyranose hydrolase